DKGIRLGARHIAGRSPVEGGDEMVAAGGGADDCFGVNSAVGVENIAEGSQGHYRVVLEISIEAEVIAGHDGEGILSKGSIVRNGAFVRWTIADDNLEVAPGYVNKLSFAVFPNIESDDVAACPGGVNGSGAGAGINACV